MDESGVGSRSGVISAYIFEKITFDGFSIGVFPYFS